jgi:hypothetical protein
MEIKLLTALLGLLGLVIGAILQHYLTTRREEKKETIERKKQCYLNLIESLSSLASAQSVNDTKKITEYSLRLDRSKLELILFANGKVLNELSKWFSEYKTNITPEAQKCFSKAFSKMRIDCGITDSEDLETAINSLIFQIQNNKK